MVTQYNNYISVLNGVQWCDDSPITIVRNPTTLLFVATTSNSDPATYPLHYSFARYAKEDYEYEYTPYDEYGETGIIPRWILVGAWHDEMNDDSDKIRVVDNNNK